MAEHDEFWVRFWGVRGSIACPGEDTRRYGGNTSCVELRCGRHRLVFDGGTGFRRLGNSLLGADPLDADLFLSHAHLDHIVGIPFFQPAFDPRHLFHVWAGHLPAGDTIRATLAKMMTPPLFPVPQDIFKATILHHEFAAGDVLNPKPGIVIRTAPLNHPNGATGYRVDYAGKAVCYVTDTEHVIGQPDRNVLDLIQGADIVIYDANYTDEGFAQFIHWGHSTWQEGVRLCRAAGAKTLVLFHHDPSRDDKAIDRIAKAAARAFPGTVAAREGLVLRP